MLKPEQVPDGPARAYLKALEAAKSWRECFAAAINAWPGAFPHTFRGPLEGHGYVLPLIKENPDAEA